MSNERRLEANRGTVILVHGNIHKDVDAISQLPATDISTLQANEEGASLVLRFVKDYGTRTITTVTGSFNARYTIWEDTFGQELLITFSGSALHDGDDLIVGTAYRLSGVRIVENSGRISARAIAMLFECEPVVLDEK